MASRAANKIITLFGKLIKSSEPCVRSPVSLAAIMNYARIGFAKMLLFELERGVLCCKALLLFATDGSHVEIAKIMFCRYCYRSSFI